MQSLQLRQRDDHLRISRAMTSRQDLPSLLRLILNSAAEMVGGEVGLLVLRQADGRLIPQAIFGLSSAKAAGLAARLMELPPLVAGAGSSRSLPELSLPLVSAAAGVPAINLDPWAMRPDLISALAARASIWPRSMLQTRRSSVRKNGHPAFTANRK